VLVSTVTPLYNLGHFLPDAINSLLAQQYQNLEIIIVNDGSKDDSGSVADKLAKRDGRIRVIHQENRGLSGAMNRGFGEARGDAMIILSPDDMLHPVAIGDMVMAMNRTSADIVNVDMLINGKHIKTRAADLESLKIANCHGYAALFKRWVFEKTGGFKTTMNPSWEDYEFFLNAAKCGARWHRIPKPHFVYRPNPNGRNAEAQGQDRLLRGKLEGYHQDIFGHGRGIVTFIIPLYDQEQWVREAAESALGQIYPHIEVIVVNDGSPGDPATVLDGLPVWLINQENRGLSGARNTGIRAAIERLGSQYLVCLDADDRAKSTFVEKTMAKMGNDEYIYTDFKFIGDAWHDFPVEDFGPELWDKHLHACTFLFQANMWQQVVDARGYGYDESMKSGYEDWEFALACAELGWCGKRIKEPLFNYRYHKNGSMRTRATKKNAQLVKYIRSRHSKEAVKMGCASCGGKGKYTGGAVNSRATNISGVQTGGAIMVTYTGPKTGMIRKLGARSKLYSYSANKRTFYAEACDRHLFEHGPYQIRPVSTPIQEQMIPEPKSTVPPQMVRMDGAPGVSPITQAPTMPAQPPQLPKEPIEPQKIEKLKQSVSRVYTGDNLARIKGLTRPQAERLVIAGVTTYKAIVDLTPVELSSITGCSYSDAQSIIGAAIDALRAKEKKDDFTQLKGIGPSKAEKLLAAGFERFADIAAAKVEKIAEALGTTESKAKRIKNEARELAG